MNFVGSDLETSHLKKKEKRRNPKSSMAVAADIGCWSLAIGGDEVFQSADEDFVNYCMGPSADCGEDDDDDDDTNKVMIPMVPRKVRDIKSNDGCFDPSMVAIGPHHHCSTPELKSSQKFKKMFLRRFIDHIKSKNESPMNLFNKLKMKATDAKACYPQRLMKNVTDENFWKMMFIDGCFVLEFISNLSLDLEDAHPSGNADPVQKKIHSQSQSKPPPPPSPSNDDQMKLKSHEIVFARRDLFLLENQIPFSVLKVLTEARFESYDEGLKKINQFVADYRPVSLDRRSTPSNNANTEAPPPLHLLDLLWRQLIGPPIPTSKKKRKWIPFSWCTFRSVTELEKLGIDFRTSKGNCFTDVSYQSLFLRGKVRIPAIAIYDTTKSLLLNLVAYEMSPNGPNCKVGVTAYICFMDSLIDNPEDVRLLRNYGILLNSLGSDQQVADLFNEIATDLVPDSDAYADVKTRIENHIRFKPTTWMNEFFSTHFSSPWTILAFMGAIFALILTLIQTYCSISGLKDPLKSIGSTPKAPAMAPSHLHY